MKFPFLIEAAFYLPLVPAVLAVVKWKNMKRHQRWFAILLWSTLVISFTSRIWVRTTDFNNMPFFHTYILVELILFLVVFKFMLGETVKNHIWWMLAIGFFVLWVINIFAGQGWWGFPDYVHAAEAVVILSLVIRWILKLLKEKKIAQPEKTFEFWLCVGLLIVFSGNFLLFLFPKFLVNTGKDLFQAIWTINGVLILLQYLSYTTALLWVRKTAK